MTNQKRTDIDEHFRSILALYGIPYEEPQPESFNPLLEPLGDELENLARDFYYPEEYTYEFMGRRAVLDALLTHYKITLFRELSPPEREDVKALLEAGCYMNMVIDYGDIPGEVIRAKGLLERRAKGEIAFDPDAY